MCVMQGKSAALPACAAACAAAYKCIGRAHCGKLEGGRNFFLGKEAAGNTACGVSLSAHTFLGNQFAKLGKDAQALLHFSSTHFRGT